MLEQTGRFPVDRHSEGKHTQDEDVLVVEEPLEIRLGGRAVAVVMRTPGHDMELAAGFALTESMIHNTSDIASISWCTHAEKGTEQNIVNVIPGPDAPPFDEGWQRTLYSASSCGICGKASIAAVRVARTPVDGGIEVTRRQLTDWAKRMAGEQPVFDRTGSIHAAAIFCRNDTLLVVREDIGRHNAVDKTIGWALMEDRFPLGHCALLVSGRTSFEIVQKAAMAGIPMVAGVSGVSSLAVELARELNMTLIGFLRGNRLNVYSGVERVNAS